MEKFLALAQRILDPSAPRKLRPQQQKQHGTRDNREHDVLAGVNLQQPFGRQQVRPRQQRIEIHDPRRDEQDVDGQDPEAGMPFELGEHWVNRGRAR